MQHWKRKARGKQIKARERYQQDSDSDSNLSTDDSDWEEAHGIIGQMHGPEGQPLQKKYFPIRYLGKGTFAKVWLVYDVIENTYRAMKVVNPKYFQEARDEIKLMKDIKKHDPDGNEKVIHMVDCFKYSNADDERFICIIKFLKL